MSRLVVFSFGITLMLFIGARYSEIHRSDGTLWTRGLNLTCGQRKQVRGTMCSLESSLTSSESSGRTEEEKQYMDEEDSNNGASGRKRNAATDSGGGSVDQLCGKSCDNKLRNSELSEMLDLNRKYHREIDSIYEEKGEGEQDHEDKGDEDEEMDKEVKEEKRVCTVDKPSAAGYFETSKVSKTSPKKEDYCLKASSVWMTF
ncbi:hypothetical protein RJT34_16618 [Clitoria ternatea]|uniref:Uncharacterized protein n=1 Tax=Clitoria ternatea TaxID=43366 RepID=A0AAN9J9I8_CLITE